MNVNVRALGIAVLGAGAAVALAACSDDVDGGDGEKYAFRLDENRTFSNFKGGQVPIDGTKDAGNGAWLIDFWGRHNRLSGNSTPTGFTAAPSGRAAQYQDTSIQGTRSADGTIDAAVSDITTVQSVDEDGTTTTRKITSVIARATATEATNGALSGVIHLAGIDGATEFTYAPSGDGWRLTLGKRYWEGTGKMSSFQAVAAALDIQSTYVRPVADQ